MPQSEGGLPFREIVVGSLVVVAVGSVLALVGGGFVDAPPTLRAGPFGIDMGEPLGQLGRVTNEGGGEYELKSPPSPHSAFFEYYITATPETGVCKIEAHTPGTSFGLDDDFKKVKVQLDAKYGNSSQRPFSQHCPYAIEWTEGSGAKLTDNIERIVLGECGSKDVIRHQVSLDYYFKNFKMCDDIIQKPMRDLLEKEQKDEEERARKDAGKL